MLIVNLYLNVFVNFKSVTKLRLLTSTIELNKKFLDELIVQFTLI
jgi:hypothetical protein